MKRLALLVFTFLLLSSLVIIPVVNSCLTTFNEIGYEAHIDKTITIREGTNEEDADKLEVRVSQDETCKLVVDVDVNEGDSEAESHRFIISVPQGSCVPTVKVENLGVSDRGTIEQLQHDINYDSANLRFLVRSSRGTKYLLTISFLVSRSFEADILSNEKRRRVYEYIKAHPGAYLREIMRSLSIGPNEAKWHLRLLEKHQFVDSERCGNYLIFLPKGSDYKISDFKIRVATLNPKVIKILDCLKEEHNPTLTAISQETGLHVSTVKYHVNKLEALGVVQKTRGYRQVNVKLSHPVAQRTTNAESV